MSDLPVFVAMELDASLWL